MADKDELVMLLKDWRSAAVLLSTLCLTLFKDLTTGIISGCVLAVVLHVTGAALKKRTGGERRPVRSTD